MKRFERFVFCVVAGLVNYGLFKFFTCVCHLSDTVALGGLILSGLADIHARQIFPEDS